MVTAQCEFCLRRYLKAAMSTHLQVNAPNGGGSIYCQKTKICAGRWYPVDNSTGECKGQDAVKIQSVTIGKVRVC